MAHKFQEANGWIGADRAGIKNQGYSSSETVPLKSTRTIDFSAPRFKSSEERYKELSRSKKLGIQKLGPSAPVADVPETKENSKNPSEAGPSSSEAERNKKMDTFSVQVGPSVNIQRELVAQSLGDIHISPDPSFVPESRNVGTYMVRRDCSVKPSSPTRKEKLVQISEKNESTKGSRRVAGGRQRTRNSKVLSEPGSNVEKKPEEKPVSGPERSGDISLKNNERSIETVERLQETEAETMSSEDKENLVSRTSSDRRLEEDLAVQPSIHGSLATEQEAGSATPGIDDSMKKSSEPRNDQKQVRFNDKEAAANLEENPKAASESFRLDIPSTSKETEARRADASPLCQGAEEKQKWRQQKVGKKEEQERSRRYRVIDQRFSTVFKQYCSQSEKCLKNGAYSAASSAESSGDAEESKDLDDLYDPSINELDNVLLAYSKMINDVVRSTKTIEKLLLKPEIDEYRPQNRATTETSESCSSTALNESAVEAAQANVSHHLRAKRGMGPRAKDFVHRDRFPLSNKRANKELHSQKVMETKAVRPAPTKSSLRAKGDSDRRKRHVVPKALGKCPPRGGPRAKERFGAPKKLLNEETAESSGSTEAKRALEFEEFRSRKGNDSSSLTALSINTLSSTADGRVRSAEAASRASIGEVAEEITNFKADTTSMKGTEVEDLQKRRFDYASLYNIVHSDVLKGGFPKLKDTPSIAERLIARVLEEEARFIEDKIKNTFNANQIVPVLVNGLLENLQSEALNSRSQNLGLLISENVSANGAASANIQAVESARSDEQSPKGNLQIKYPSSNENFRVPRPINRDEKIIEEKAFSGPSEDDTHAETIDNRKSQQPPVGDGSVSQKSHRDLSLDGRSKTDCDAESLNNDLNTRNDGIDPDGNIQNVVPQECRLNKDFKVQGNDNDNSSSRRDCLRLVNEENETASAVQKDMLQNVKKDADCALEAIDEPLMIGRNEECASCKDSAALDRNLSPSNDVVSKVKEGETPVRCNLSEDEAKTIAQSSNNVHQMSSSDSLHNCASLHSSPRNISKQSLNVGGSSFQINEMEQFSERNNAVDGEVDGPGDQTGSFRDSVFDREKILSGLDDDVHRKVLLSTFDEDHSSTADQNGR